MIVTTHAFPTSVRAGSGVSMRLAVDSDAEMITAWMRAREVYRFWGGRAMGAR